jgi:hypothetical protein
LLAAGLGVRFLGRALPLFLFTNPFLEEIMSREMTFWTEDDIEVSVEYEYTAGCRGSRENGVPIEPDTPAEVEILSCKDDEGNDVELSERDVAEICEKAEEDVESDYEDWQTEMAISRWEREHGRW